jgi:hypothetical protein
LPSAAGLSERACLNKSFWELFESVSGGDCAARIARGIRERQPFVITVAGGSCSHLLMEFRPATSYHLSSAAPEAGEGAFGEGMGEGRCACFPAQRGPHVCR